MSQYDDARGLYRHMLQQPHLLIAGTTGSGKSTLIDCLLYELTTAGATTLLIDPKRVGLTRWGSAPGVAGVICDPQQAAPALRNLAKLMNDRYAAMAAQGETEATSGHIWTIIDEFAALTLRDKSITPPLLDLAQMGRAAGIHLILATQAPSRQVITPAIRLNIPAAVALRCQSAIESRQIIGQPGAELLPRWGYGIYTAPDLVHPAQIELPPVPPDLLRAAMQPRDAIPASLQRGAQLTQHRRQWWPFAR